VKQQSIGADTLPDTDFQQQDQQAPSCSSLWLSHTPHENIEAELEELKASGTMLQAQLRDMQLLGQGAELRLRHARTMHQSSDAQHARDASALSSKRAALASLNSQLNLLLEQLQGSTRVSMGHTVLGTLAQSLS
jgi:hypothetical protein